MADYREIETALDAIIGTGNRYFNPLNFTYDALTFVENKRGTATRMGKRGNWLLPNLAPLGSGTLRKTAYRGDWLQVDGNRVETPFYTVRLNADGSVASLYDKKIQREWTDGAFNKLTLYEDKPGNYDAWDILPNYRDKQVPLTVAQPLTLIEQDSESVTFKTVLQTDKSTWTQYLRLFRRDGAIEVENQVDWQEKHVLAKVLFDCNVLARQALCDTSAGYIARDTHRNTTWQQARFECCHHKWCDLSETDGGVAILNDGKYGVGFLENQISLSLLRSPIRPDVTADMGHHSFCYRIVPHAGDPVQAGINRRALQFNQPPIKSDVAYNGTDFAPLYLQAMKFSEDGKRIVVRLSEQDGRRGTLRLPRKVQVLNMLEDVERETDSVDYTPFEILTLGWPVE